MDDTKRQELIKQIDYEIHVLQRLKATLEDDQPTIPHDQVMQEAREILNRTKAVK